MLVLKRISEGTYQVVPSETLSKEDIILFDSPKGLIECVVDRADKDTVHSKMLRVTLK